MSFVHLRVHTEYSLSDSIINIEGLASRAAKYRMPAVGITELHNAYSAIKAYKTCRKFGVKPILGAEVTIDNPKHPEMPFLLALICQNLNGFQSLCRLLTKAHQRVKAGDQIGIQADWLSESECQGLIALSAGVKGEVGQSLVRNQQDNAVQVLERYQSIFPQRFFLEISRFDEESETVYNDAVLNFAEHTSTPLVATHQPRFLDREDYQFHELKLTIHEQQGSGTNRPGTRNYTDQQYFCSPEEMAEKFKDIPGAVENSLEIAKRCNLKLDLNDTTHMPPYRTDSENLDINEYLKKSSYEGLENRFDGQYDERYVDRLEHEIAIITKTNFAGYFLIVSDIIRWAKSHGIPVGPGRGSGAGSLVAYCLDITSVDPIRHDLIFERFLNPDRVSPPDFDIDFCVWEREKVIEHVVEQYGQDQVAQIITYQTMAARAAVKNVGRALRPDYLFYDQVAKLIPLRVSITLKEALQDSSDLRQRYENESRIKELIDSSMKLEGMVLNVSKHPAGLVIAPTRITDFTPLMADTEGSRDTTHLDKDDLEAIGLVKFDFLGLKTLTIIALTLQTVNEKRNGLEPLTDDSIPEDDEETYKYISSGRTAGIFQLESGGMRRLILAIRPSEFSDLVALLALFRPGPLQNKMDQMYIENQTKHDHEIPHPDLKEVLDQSHGVILYQEQVMKIAQIMSGYTLAEADGLRKAMGKKLKQEMQEQRKRFVSGALDNGYQQKLATKVYDLIESFGGYGFNKSHSVAYAMLAYRTAYLKTHFRTDYLAAFMSVDMDNKTIVKLCVDAKSHGIEVLPPDINKSTYRFQALDEKTILFGLGALKRVGKVVVDAIEKSRDSGGEFKDLMDFCLKVDLQVVTKLACEALICAGAFDKIDSNRGGLFNQIDQVYRMAQRRTEDAMLGQQSLFGDDSHDIEIELPQVADNGWSTVQKLSKEHEILGLYLSGHLVELYADELRTLSMNIVNQITEIRANSKELIIAAGSVCNFIVIERSGEKSAYFEIEDASGQQSVVVRSEEFLKYGDLLKNNQIVIVSGYFEDLKNDAQPKLKAHRVFTIDTIRRSSSVKVNLKLKWGSVMHDAIVRIKNLLTAQIGGQHRVYAEYTTEEGATVNYHLNDSWRVTVTDDLVFQLRDVLGDDGVLVDYSEVNLPV